MMKLEILPPPATEGKPPPRDFILWDDAVAEAKVIQDGLLAKTESDPWRLGEIANLIEPRYGDATLENFAQAIGCEFTALKKYRATVRSWPVKEGRASFSVSSSLNKHPLRYDIVATYPDLTRDAARETMKSWKAGNNRPRVASADPLARRLAKSFDVILDPEGSSAKSLDFIRDYDIEPATSKALLKAARGALKRVQKAVDQLESRGKTNDVVANRAELTSA
jgi:hypothetical protein